MIGAEKTLELMGFNCGSKSILNRVKNEIHKMSAERSVVLALFKIRVNVVERFHCVAFAIQPGKACRNIAAIVIEALIEKNDSRTF